jgi:hypothetical protein
MIYLNMSLTTEDLIKIQKIVQFEVREGTKDIPEIKNDISDIKQGLAIVQDAVVRLERKQEEDYAFLSLQIIDINRHLGLNK